MARTLLLVVKVDLLEDIFQPYGQVPWDDLINPLWAELVSLVEEAWLALNSGFIHQDEERLPLACLPGVIAFQPPMDGDGVVPHEPDFFKRHFPRLLTLLVSHVWGGGG